MLKNLPKTAHHQVICEANFLRLEKLMGSYAEKRVLFCSAWMLKIILSKNFILSS